MFLYIRYLTPCLSCDSYVEHSDLEYVYVPYMGHRTGNLAKEECKHTTNQFDCIAWGND